MFVHVNLEENSAVYLGEIVIESMEIGLLESDGQRCITIVSTGNRRLIFRIPGSQVELFPLAAMKIKQQ
jgi:hypothetical protein